MGRSALTRPPKHARGHPGRRARKKGRETPEGTRSCSAYMRFRRVLDRGNVTEALGGQAFKLDVYPEAVGKRMMD